MEKGVEFKVCDNCKGFSSCNKYCRHKAAESLAYMIMKADTVKTKVGDTVTIGDDEFKYCGISIDTYTSEVNSPSHIMNKLKDIKEPERLLSNMDKTTPSSILQKYFSSIKPGMAAYQSIMAKYTDIICRRQLPLFIRPGDEIQVAIAADGAGRREEGSVIQVAWKQDPATHDFNCYISCKYDKTNVTVKASDFGTHWQPLNSTKGLKAAINPKGIATMNAWGWLQPISVSDSKHTFVLDGHNLIYIEPKGTATIIGEYLMDNRFRELSDVPKSYSASSAMKVIKHIIPYVSNIRNYIIPFGFADVSKIDADEYISKHKLK